MAPQTTIPLAATVLGTIGTIFWSIQLIPQIWRNYHTKSTEGLPASMMFIWSVCGVPFGVYAIVQNFNIPIQVQAQTFCALSLVSWAQCMVYSRKWRTWATVIVFTVILIIFAVIELVLIVLLRRLYAAGINWPIPLVGVTAVILLLAGYIPIPFELIQRRGRVIGIDFIFLSMEWLGSFFSLLSVAVQEHFDVLFGTMYIICVVVELLIFVSQGIWLLRTRQMRRRAREADMTFDEFPETREWQSQAWDIRALWGHGKEDGNESVEERDDREREPLLQHGKNIGVAGVESTV